MLPHAPVSLDHRPSWRTAIALLPALLLAACGIRPTPPAQTAPPPGPAAAPPPALPASPPPATSGTAPGPAQPTPPAAAIPPSAPSQATTPRAYRADAARHVYIHNAHRIWKGKLQPNLYAIGVLEVDIDRQGRVTATRWMRAPQHAPEVMAEILRTVRAAAPYPAPARMGRVTYTDVWLWDRSGQFQLDTLTEGQL